MPAAFTVATGKAHWETLLRARAIETGAYIIAPAQGGHHEDGRRTWGRSLIIDPWGEVISGMGHDEPGFIIADISKTSVERARRCVISGVATNSAPSLTAARISLDATAIFASTSIEERICMAASRIGSEAQHLSLIHI